MERKTSEYPNYKYDYIKLLQRKTFYKKKNMALKIQNLIDCIMLIKSGLSLGR